MYSLRNQRKFKQIINLSFSGPLVSVLCARFGCRLISVLGAFMSGMGMILSVFAPSVEYLFFSFGLFTGQ